MATKHGYVGRAYTSPYDAHQIGFDHGAGSNVRNSFSSARPN